MVGVGVIFFLRCILAHQGDSIAAGHYLAYVRAARAVDSEAAADAEPWLCCDDRTCSMTTCVCVCGGGDEYALDLWSWVRNSLCAVLRNAASWCRLGWAGFGNGAATSAAATTAVLMHANG